GKSEIGPEVPRASQLQRPLARGWKRPENVRSFTCKANVSVPFVRWTPFRAVDARPATSMLVPCGTRARSPTGSPSAARPRYAGYVARIDTAPTNGRSVTRTVAVSLADR